MWMYLQWDILLPLLCSRFTRFQHAPCSWICMIHTKFDFYFPFWLHIRCSYFQLILLSSCIKVSIPSILFFFFFSDLYIYMHHTGLSPWRFDTLSSHIVRIRLRALSPSHQHFVYVCVFVCARFTRAWTPTPDLVMLHPQEHPRCDCPCWWEVTCKQVQMAARYMSSARKAQGCRLHFACNESLSS